MDGCVVRVVPGSGEGHFEQTLVFYGVISGFEYGINCLGIRSSVDLLEVGIETVLQNDFVTIQNLRDSRSLLPQCA